MRRAALATLLGAAVAATTAGTASAQLPQPVPQPQPAPAPQPGKIRLQVLGRTAAHGHQYVLTGDTVTVIGHVTPYVQGQAVTVRIHAPKHKPAKVRAAIGKGRGEGTFRVRFHVRRNAAYSIVARHDATPEQAAFSASASVSAVAPGKPMAIVLLKRGLRALGYPAGNGPSSTAKLGRELLAFRKVNGMARIYSANRRIYELVLSGRGAFKLRYPKAGKHVEADLSKQVVVLAADGRPVATYPTSSGKPSTPTVLGHFHFYTKSPGTNAKGMYMSNYFIRGYAIHGYPEVPTYAASHGCLRVPNEDAVAIFNQISLGESIWVYL